MRIWFGGAATLATLFLSASLRAQGAATFTVGVAADETERSKAIIRGIDLGFREASHAATLFRKKIERVPVSDCLDVKGAQVVIHAGSADRTRHMSAECAAAGVVFINAGASGDELRAHCHPLVFHVAASDAMRRKAAAPSQGVSVETWHASLERFGAGQLNDRFRETGSEMGSAEWAGWMSVKIAWEAFLRVADGTAPAIAAWLSRDATHFDGHKGAPLSFRSWDHQLRQPLYLVRPDGAIEDVPSLSRSDIPVRELLDTLDEHRGEEQCS